MNISFAGLEFHVCLKRSFHCCIAWFSASWLLKGLQKRTRMRSCCVPGCTSKRVMFRAPREQEKFEKWSAVLPLTPKSFVCHLHFRDEDIQTKFVHHVNGSIYEVERGKPRLAAEAVPCRNLDYTNNASKITKSAQLAEAKEATKCSEYDTFTSREQTLRTPRSEETDYLLMEQLDDIKTPKEIICETKKSEDEGGKGKIEMCTLVEEAENVITIESRRISEAFDNLFDDAFEVVLPNTLWAVHRCLQRSIIIFAYVDAIKLATTKMVTVDNKGKVKFILEGTVIGMLEDIPSTDELSGCLARLDKTEFCNI